MKNVFVGLVWACIPLGLGVYYRQLFEPGLLVIAVVFAIVLTVAAAVFDIKDVEGDRLEGIRTVPVVLGVARTRKLCVAGIALAVPAIVAGALVLTPRFFVLLVYVGYLGIAIPLANPDRGELFYGLIVDGEHLAVAGVAASIWLL